MTGELPKESDQFRFLRSVCLTHLKDSVGLILTKALTMRVTIPLDVSTRSFISAPHLFHSRRVPTLLAESFPSRVS